MPAAGARGTSLITDVLQQPSIIRNRPRAGHWQLLKTYTRKNPPPEYRER